MRRFAFGVACSAVVGSGLPAQEVVRSMGQPPRWEPYVVPALTLSHDVMLVAGVHHPITNPDTDLPRLPGAPLVSALPSAARQAALARMSDAAMTLLAYTNLFPDLSQQVRYGESYGAVVATYHEALGDIFGDSLVARARRNV